MLHCNSAHEVRGLQASAVCGRMQALLSDDECDIDFNEEHSIVWDASTPTTSISKRGPFFGFKASNLSCVRAAKRMIVLGAGA